MSTIALGSCLAALAAHPEQLMAFLDHARDLSPQSFVSWLDGLPTKALLFTGFISTDLVLLIEFIALKV